MIRPVAVYLLSVGLSLMVMAIPEILLNWDANYQLSHIYIIGTIGQLLMDLPAVFLSIRLWHRSRVEDGVKTTTRDRVISLSVGIACAALLAAVRILLSGHLMQGRFMGGVPAFTQSLDLASPWNMIAAAVVLFAYGPGEALFVVYLIRAFDQATGNPPRPLISGGVLITAVLWALPHLFNVIYFGVSALFNVVIMFFMGILMGILLKKTRSALGPMIFWMLVNGTSA